ncbi:hypothetical protein AB0L65_40090 [Nonomuraea sp. NPDC052116]|uniref:hypothetical protein n=1 Tax=Nonomuraea sp. NPDC052116 TaxID=3155665 RepID=UPI0034491D3D
MAPAAVLFGGAAARARSYSSAARSRQQSTELPIGLRVAAFIRRDAQDFGGLPDMAGSDRGVGSW